MALLVVAPYNMQVRKLQHRLPCLRVGSVDKFQGPGASYCDLFDVRELWRSMLSRS